MKPTRSELGRAFLVLTALANCARAADCIRAQGDAPSLCFIFSVSASGPLWCEFLGTINGTPFFKYSCKSQTIKLVGPVGMMLNATESWNQRCEHWTEMLSELWKALLGNKKNITKAFGSLPLQVHMMSQQESNGYRKTFWDFGFKKQMCLRFDLKSKYWEVLHPGCRLLKETLDNNSDISKHLGWISHGDCVKLLNHSTVLDTKAAAIMAPASVTPLTVSATPTTASAAAPVPSKAMTISHNNIALILTLIFILITLGI